MSNQQVYIHLTDKKGALGIQDSKTLWASSYIEGVYAVAKGGRFVPGVQMTRLGRAKHRLVAVYFTTPELPDYCTPEECIWKAPEIPVTIVKITHALEAKRDLDGSIGVLNNDTYRERLLMPTKEMPDPENPPDFLINELRTLIKKILKEELEEAAVSPEQALAGNLGVYGYFLGSSTRLFLFDKKKLTLFTDLRDLLRMSRKEFEVERARALGKDAQHTPREIKELAESLLETILVGFINANKTAERTEGGGQVWRVSESAADKGYGPLMYEMMMHLNGKDWLGPDSTQVSAPAEKVWFTFMTRTDVESEVISPQNKRPGLDKVYRPKEDRSAAYKALLNNLSYPTNQLSNPDGFFNGLSGTFFTKKYQALYQKK